MDKNYKVRLSLNWTYELTSSEMFTEDGADEFAMYLRARVGSGCTVSIVKETETTYGDGLDAKVRCRACSIEAEIGTEDAPHPVPERFHTCNPTTRAA